MLKSFSQVLKNSAFALFSLGLVTAPAYAINITTTSNGNDLVNSILGSGITVSNVTYNGAAAASGLFTDGLSSGIGIDKGIILTTGNANLAVGPNNQDGATGSNGFPGDADLNSLIPGFNTYDAAVLEFDFESTTGDLFFNYVFASEEYNEYANTSFNDVFGFFLDGVNIALIPGTTTPVSINNVNGGNPLGTNAQNPQYYINNDLSDGGPFFNIQYDGFTKVFTAQVKGLSAGKHRIKLAIADAGDSILDSAVFIQAGTFSSEPPKDVPEPASLLGVLAVGAFGAASLRKSQLFKTPAQA
ncbi:MAG: PEP-CTERM sorting domain-containing protein [Fischerella sp.]|nr:PEP-CTERM sorting domain-containing protein [Fischerella sp.]